MALGGGLLFIALLQLIVPSKRLVTFSVRMFKIIKTSFIARTALRASGQDLSELLERAR